MAILMQAINGLPEAREPEVTYDVKPLPASKSRKTKAHGKQLSLTELWERARRLGPPSRSESAALIRSLRDERNRR